MQIDVYKTQEDVEANAFAGLLLMPDQLLSNQIDLFGIDKDDMDTDSVLSLMDMFAIPYKATVLRSVSYTHLVSALATKSKIFNT